MGGEATVLAEVLAEERKRYERLAADRDDLHRRFVQMRADYAQAIKDRNIAQGGRFADVKRLTAELGSALSRLTVLEQRLADQPSLPADEGEIRDWLASHGLAASCGLAVLFAALRRDFGQDTPTDEGAPTA